MCIRDSDMATRRRCSSRSALLAPPGGPNVAPRPYVAPRPNMETKSACSWTNSPPPHPPPPLYGPPPGLPAARLPA
eukprot:3652086-Prymnesium_polylepis.1